MSIKHASIIPLIGGETIASQQAFGTIPEYIVSYSPFVANELHLLNYYNNEVPYYLLDKNQFPSHSVDVISSTCPCAGLSMLSHGYGDHNQNNRWMIETAKYVLTDLRPEVFWGENAPGFAGKLGANIRNQLFEIGRENGYSMTVYRTRSLLHGVPQVRERSFYFFWKGDRTPLLKYYKKEHTKIEDVISKASLANSMQEPINKKTPSQDPYYRFILEEIHGGITHAEFSAQLLPSSARGNDSFSYIEKKGYDYKQVGKWMKDNGYEKEIAKCEYKHEKLSKNGNIMRRGVIVPKDYIGAFVGQYPTMLTHPVHDRFITIREALSIMGMPEDFDMIDGAKNANHICQNVPVQTAKDMATEVLEYLNGNRETIDSHLTFQYNSSMEHEVVKSNKTQKTLESFFAE